MEHNYLQPNAVTLYWDNLTAKAHDKVILDNVSGYCSPGQMLAIMGPSGAGKTTLLSLLASKKNKTLTVTGQVLANAVSFTAKQFYNFGVYIFQNDILHGNLTVKQTLQFIARLQIKNTHLAQQRVHEMISTFQLQKCQNTYVGGQFTKGISGGQKKRLCIAVQMIADPDLLILDQPTSGLDSHKVKSVIKSLRKLAFEKNKTVIFTLHQPSFLIYKDLDKLILLHKGQTIYQGQGENIYSYMQDTLKITVPLDCTISDFFMMQISDYKQTKYDYKSPLNHQNYCFHLQSQERINLKSAINMIEVTDFRRVGTARSFIEQFLILFGREWMLFLRNRMKGIRLIMISCLIVFTTGLVFLNGIKDNRPKNGELIDFIALRDYLIKAQGTCYISVLSCIMSNVNTVVLNFPNDKQIYYKQSSSKKYRSISYLIAKIITEVGLCMIGAIIMAVGQYLFVGYTINFQQFLKFIFTLMVCCMIGNSLGFLVGTLFKQARLAAALTPLLLMPLMMFSGMYSRLDSLPKWIGWIQYLSPFKYGLHALLVNEYHNQKYVTIFGEYDYRKDLQITLDYWQNIGVLIGLIVLFYGIAFILLKKLSSNLAP